MLSLTIEIYEFPCFCCAALQVQRCKKIPMHFLFPFGSKYFVMMKSGEPEKQNKYSSKHAFCSVVVRCELFCIDFRESCVVVINHRHTN